jgi:hypothetical protein
MALKKNRKQAQETTMEEPAKDRVVPSEPIGEEEPRPREDHDEPESEELQWSLVVFTQEQLEVLIKLNRPDFSELMAALKGGASKSVWGSNWPSSGTSMVFVTKRLWIRGLQKWRITYMPQRLDGTRPWNLPNPT